MGDYDWEIKDTLEKIGGALVNIAELLKDIRDKMPPQEEDYEEDYTDAGGNRIYD